MRPLLAPQETIDEAALARGLRLVVSDGVCSQIMGVLTGGAFLAAFALLLGASNTVIGLLAAVGPLSQILQIPAVALVDRVRLRKALVVPFAFVSRLFWFPAAALPFVAPPGWRAPLLLLFLFLYFGLGTIGGTAWNSWMRDLVPEGRLGDFFGGRLATATAVGAGVSLVAGVAVQKGQGWVADPAILYSALFAAGGLAGLIGTTYLARTPEPPMAPPEAHRPITGVIAEPFHDRNFRRLLVFLGWWNFAINLAAPFFAVYMLRSLGLGMGLVMGLSVLSQIFNVLFFRLVGRLADRLTNKSVLGVAGFFFLVSIALWPFLAMPEKHRFTVPLLIVIHVLAGISNAGVALCAGNIALKAAPRGKGAAYLAANALVSGLAATVAPILAGALADRLGDQRLSIDLKWLVGPDALVRFDWTAFDLQGLDFVFLAAVLVGLYALHRLSVVEEAGEVEEGVVVTEFYQEVRKAVRNISSVAGLRHLTYFPYGKLDEPVHRDEVDDF